MHENFETNFSAKVATNLIPMPAIEFEKRADDYTQSARKRVFIMTFSPAAAASVSARELFMRGLAPQYFVDGNVVNELSVNMHAISQLRD